jgi:hypothetical protein
MARRAESWPITSEWSAGRRFSVDFDFGFGFLGWPFGGDIWDETWCRRSVAWSLPVLVGGLSLSLVMVYQLI